MYLNFLFRLFLFSICNNRKNLSTGEKKKIRSVVMILLSLFDVLVICERSK